MRSKQNRINFIGSICKSQSVKSIVRRNADRPATSDFTGALYAVATCWANALHAALWHWPTATCVTAHVTGGATLATMRGRSGRRECMRRLAAS
jgi:hypothetical protein